MSNNRATFVVGADSDMGTAILQGLTGTVIAHTFAAPDKVNGLDTDTRRVIPVSADLSTQDGILGLAQAVKELGYDVDKMVFLPCLPARPTKFKNFDAERFEAEWRVGFLSAALLCRELLPAMAKRKFGRVVFMLTSYCIGVPPKFLASYVSTKYALLGLMRALAAEYADKGITVNGVAPSMTQTNFLSELADLTVEAGAKNHPLGRNARPDDIAPAFWHLLDDGNEYTSGAVIPVTGGSQF